MNVTNNTDTTARLPRIIVDGYWRDDKTEFYGYVVSQSDDIEENDDDIFFYGLSESQIAESLGKETGADFVITAYAVLRSCLAYMSEADVEDMAHCEGFVEDDELPPSHVDSPLYDKWLAIVTQMEAEGCDRSDAQSIADIEVAN